MMQNRQRSSSACARTRRSGERCAATTGSATSVGKSPPMQALFELVEDRSARDRSTVLVLGESGTGKELLARAIHAREPARGRGRSWRSTARRCPRRCSRASCSATRRARSPARPRRPRAASSGRTAARCSSTRSATSPPSCRSSCCACSQEREFEPGRRRTRRSASTCASSRRPTAISQQAVAEGRFREDLFYRLNVVPIELPPLRERREDIPLLVEHFLERMSAELGRRVDGVSRDAMAMLMSYPCPGNIRELRNLLERAVVCAAGPDFAGERLRHRRDGGRGVAAAGVARGGRAAAHRRDPGAVRRQRHARGAHPRHRPRHALQQESRCTGCGNRT